MVNPTRLSWKSLENRVVRIRKTDPQHPIWQELEDRPLNPGAVFRLKKNGWRVVFDRSLVGSPDWGRCDYEDRLFELNPEAGEGYETHSLLCHEVAHAHFKSLNPNKIPPNRPYSEEEEERRVELLTEWMARLVRADPLILREVVRQFGVKPLIYDRASYLAFGKGDQHDKYVTMPLMMD